MDNGIRAPHPTQRSGTPRCARMRQGPKAAWVVDQPNVESRATMRLAAASSGYVSGVRT